MAPLCECLSRGIRLSWGGELTPNLGGVGGSPPHLPAKTVSTRRAHPGPSPTHLQTEVLAEDGEGSGRVGRRFHTGRNPCAPYPGGELESELGACSLSTEAPSQPSFPGVRCGWIQPAASSLGMKQGPSQAILSCLHKHLEIGQTLAHVWTGPVWMAIWKGLMVWTNSWMDLNVQNGPSPVARHKE